MSFASWPFFDTKASGEASKKCTPSGDTVARLGPHRQVHEDMMVRSLSLGPGRDRERGPSAAVLSTGGKGCGKNVSRRELGSHFREAGVVARRSHSRGLGHLDSCQAGNRLRPVRLAPTELLGEEQQLSKLVRGLAAGWGAKKLGGCGCGGLLIFILLYWLLGQSGIGIFQ
jgi:hypothetical protein